MRSPRPVSHQRQELTAVHFLEVLGDVGIEERSQTLRGKLIETDDNDTEDETYESCNRNMKRLT